MTALDPELLASVETRLENGRRLRRRLPGGGRIHVDRAVPYLCVTTTGEAPEAALPVPWLVRAQAAHLDPAGAAARELAPLVRQVLGTLRRLEGEALLCAVWEHPVDPEMIDTPCRWARPRFEVVVPPSLEAALGDPFVEALRGLEGYGHPALVSCSRTLLPSSVPDGDGNGARLGIAVAPVYRGRQRELLPEVARSLERRFAVALRRGLYGYCRSLEHRVPHAFALGRRTLSQAGWNVDRRLAAVDRSFDLLALVSPCNSREAWKEFSESGFRKPPSWRYRPLPLDVEVSKRELFDIPIERVEDPVLAELFREKQEELDRQLTLLRDRGTRRFLPGSLQLYPAPSKEELARARDILARFPAPDAAEPTLDAVDAEGMAAAAREEIGRYRVHDARFEPDVVIDPDQPGGLLVSADTLSIGADTRIAPDRVAPLLHHEIGIHLITFHNGSRQRLRLFRCGFAGYEPLQEGIAVLGEALVGGLTRSRIRTLAGRVVACDLVATAAPFPETFCHLVDEHGFSPGPAFHLVMRVYRGGGLTKDGIYLRGLEDLLAHLRTGGALDDLLVGKLALGHLPVLRELTQRNFFRKPPLSPRFLGLAGARERLAALRDGTDPLEWIP